MSIVSSINAINEAGKRKDRDAIAKVLDEVKLMLLTQSINLNDICQFFESYICIAVTLIPEEIDNAIQLYKSFCKDDPKAERKLLIESLYLLYLLVSNNLPTFHAELELLSDIDMSNPYIQFSIATEGYLTTGRYSKLQESMQHLPDPIFSDLMKYLIESVQRDTESCIEVSFKEMSLAQYCKMINWKGSAEQAIQHIQEQHGDRWQVTEDGMIHFPVKQEENTMEAKKTLGDLIFQLNDFERIFTVCS